MILKLQPFFKGTVILGGDSNLLFDLSLDKFRAKKPQNVRPPRQSLQVVHQQNTLGMVDIWRGLNPRAKNYTHYSAPHQTYARIDHIFLPASDIPFAIFSKIRDTSLSDHSIMSLNIRCPLGKPYKWRLNESLLSNPVHCTILKKSLQEFFSDNNIGSVSPSTLWVAHKRETYPVSL